MRNVRPARKTEGERERERESEGEGESRAGQQSLREILAVSQVAAARRYYVRVKIIRDMNLRPTLWPTERKKHENRAKSEKEARGGERKRG